MSDTLVAPRQRVPVNRAATAGTTVVWKDMTAYSLVWTISELSEPAESTDEWASEDILTPEVLAEFHRASDELLARRP